jgi:phosphate transport system substrate-binding protein
MNLPKSHRSGQIIVFLFSVFIILGLSGCNSASQDKKLTIAGSTTILPLSEDWAAAFFKKYKTIVNVQGGGSTTGIKLVKEKKVDIGASSRDLSKEESENIELVAIGKDALAVIVNQQNPVSNLSNQQLKKVFSGEITNWKELGGPDRSIQVINRESGSGTRKTFEEIVMCFHSDTKTKAKASNTKTSDSKGSCSSMVLSAVVLNSNAEVKKSVELIKDSIGYISLGFVDERVKSLSLNGISPLAEEIKNGQYPIARTLYYLLPEGEKKKRSEVKKFLEYIQSEEGQKILEHEGYLPVL